MNELHELERLDGEIQCKKAEMALLDMSCCCENMLIQAAALDMGSVWLSFAPMKERQEPAKKVLGLPEGLEVFAVLPVGYPKGEGKIIDRFDAGRIHWEA